MITKGGAAGAVDHAPSAPLRGEMKSAGADPGLASSCASGARRHVGALRLSTPADVDDRTGVMLEPFAQVDELRLVGQEVPVIVHHFVGEDRLVACRRRDDAPPP